MPKGSQGGGFKNRDKSTAKPAMQSAGGRSSRADHLTQVFVTPSSGSYQNTERKGGKRGKNAGPG